MKKELTIGKIVRPHGIKGELKVIPTMQDLSFLDYIENLVIDDQAYAVENVKFVKDAFVVKLEGIDSIEDAEKFRDKKIGVRREDLEKDDKNDFYAEDLIGCKVYLDKDNRYIGKIADIQNYGSADVVVLQDGTEELMCPMVDGLIFSTDFDAQIVVFDKSKFLEVADYED